MSQINNYLAGGGPGGGTVTSVSGGVGINITGTPTVNPTVNLNVPVVIANGGTNATSFTNTNGVIYFDGTRLISTTVGTAGQVLRSNGVGFPPTFQTGGGGSVTSVTAGTGITVTGTPTLNPTVSLTVPVAIANGGTNATSMANTDGVVYFDGTRLSTTAVGTSGQVLTSNGAGVAPTFAAASGGSITINGDVGSISGSTLTFTGGTSGAVFTGSSTTMTESFNFLNLPDTTAGGTVGYIAFNGVKYIHQYGNDNFFAGQGAGNFTLTTGLAVGNVGVGFEALKALTTGNTNVAVGIGSLAANSTGSSNVAIGTQALGDNISGDGNVAIGTFALLELTTALQNVAVGSGALESITDSSRNVAVGFSALTELVGPTGLGNQVAVGDSALASLTSGVSNIAIGASAGGNYTSNESSNIVIGTVGTINDDNTIRIGTQGSGTGQQNLCFVAGIVGVTTSNTQMVTIDSTTGQLGAATVAGGFTWTVITANTGMAVNNGYIANKAGTAILTLPASAAVGDIIRVTGINTATGWQIAQNSGQTIYFGTFNTTTGTGGSLASTQIRDTIELVCVATNTDWNVLSSIGNITVV